MSKFDVIKCFTTSRCSRSLFTLILFFFALCQGLSPSSSLASLPQEEEEIDWNKNLPGHWKLNFKETDSLVHKSFSYIDTQYLSMTPVAAFELNFFSSKQLKQAKSFSENREGHALVIQRIKKVKDNLVLEINNLNKTFQLIARPISKHRIAIQIPISPFGPMEAVYSRLNIGENGEGVKHFQTLQGQWNYSASLSESLWKKSIPETSLAGYRRLMESKKNLFQSFVVKSNILTFPGEGSSEFLQPIKERQNELTCVTKMEQGGMRFRFIGDNLVVLSDIDRNLFAVYEKTLPESKKKNLKKMIRIPRIRSLAKIISFINGLKQKGTRNTSKEDQHASSGVQIDEISIKRRMNLKAAKPSQFGSMDVRFWIKGFETSHRENQVYRFGFSPKKKIVDDMGKTLLDVGEYVPASTYSMPIGAYQIIGFHPPSRNATKIRSIAGEITARRFKRRMIWIDDLRKWDGKILTNPLVKDCQFRVEIIEQFANYKIKLTSSKEGFLHRIERIDLFKKPNQFSGPDSYSNVDDIRSFGYFHSFGKKIPCWITVLALEEEKVFPFEMKDIILP